MYNMHVLHVVHMYNNNMYMYMSCTNYDAMKKPAKDLVTLVNLL